MFTLRPLAVLIASLTLMISSVPALAVQSPADPIDPSAVQLNPGEQNGVTYLSGGIGQDEAQAIRQTRGYNLHLEFFAGPTDEFTSDVDVSIQSPNGKQWLMLNQTGPIVLVKLPQGQYQVTLSRNGNVKKENVTISASGAKTVNVHWNSLN
ncbi:carboxypeptidase regulatory-like domain-containing protein [Pseudomonas sp. NA-150]|uniref:carboxypeptidase regulatory-like domain-containing protein n=1 Tax=Pseudomonas sp. NA-150 TaxID=3367525 RepID=UPI0037CA3B94